jgi:cobalt-zinc-cadmium efflux system outer membrane protein
MKHFIWFAAWMVLSFGCQTYDAAPLGLETFADVIVTEPDVDGVAAFARRLSVSQGQPAEVFDLSDGISRHEAEAIALLYNPELRIRRARVAVAQAGAKHAGAWEDPHLEGELLRFTENMPDRWISAVGVQFTIPISGRLEVERDQAASRLTLAERRVVAAEWKTVGEVRSAWIAWSASRRDEVLLSDYLADLGRLRGVVEKLAKTAEIEQTDLGSLQIEEAMQRLELSALRATLLAQRQALFRTLGLSSSAKLVFVPSLSIHPPKSESKQDPLLGHPDMAVSRAEYELAEQTLRREIHKQYPDLDIGPVFEREEGQSRIGLSAGIPIPSINLNRRGIAEAKAERDVARVEAHATYMGLTAELASAQLEAKAARARRLVLVQTVAPIVDQQRKRLQKLIEIGELDVLMLEQTLGQDLSVKQQILAAIAAEAAALGRIRSLTDPQWQRPIGQTKQAESVDQETP